MGFDIKIISEETIKPSNPTPQHLRHLRASLFDHVNIPILMPLIFFYSPRNSTSLRSFEFLDRLKRSLPTTLSIFYPLAGRVEYAQYITCNDEGVPYIQAEINSTTTCLDDVVHKADVSQLDKLLPFYDDQQMIYTNLLLAIQVNTFGCGGVAIGVKMSHVVSDAFSIIMFVKTWADIAAGKDPTLLQQPCFDIWKIFPPPSQPQHETTTAPVEPNPDIVRVRPATKWFMFGRVKLEALRSKLWSRFDIKRPSLGMVLASFIWSRYNFVCRNIRNYDGIPHEVNHAVSLRENVIVPSHRSYYFGNMFVNAIANLSSELEDNESIRNDFVENSMSSIEKILGENGEFIKGMQQGKEDLGYLKEHFVKKSRGEIFSVGFSNIRSLPVYEPDFGWGKPVWVTSATLQFRNCVILIPASPSSDDIIAYVNLKAEEMTLLETDPEFVLFSSSENLHHVSKL